MNLFSALDFDGLAPTPVNTGAAWRVVSDLLLILAAALALTLVLILWAKYFRRSKSHRSRSPALSSKPEAERTEDSFAENSRNRRRKKRRHSKHEHRPRNATLAETGGLPPLRPEGPTPPPQ